MPASGTIPPPSSGGGETTFVTPDALTVNVTDFGAVADFGQNGVGADNYAAIMAAQEYIIAQGLNSYVNRRRAWIYFPGARYPYRTSRTIPLLAPWIGIKGDGPGASELVCQEGPVVRVGLRETETGLSNSTVALTAEHRPTRVGVMDGTLTGHGHRTMGNATIIFGCCPLTLGPKANDGFGRTAWGTTSQFTVEVALARPDGGVWPSGQTFGIWQFGCYPIGTSVGGMPVIFTLKKGTGENQFDLSLTDSGENTGNISVSLPGATGVMRIGFQVDLTAKTAQVFFNGTQRTAGISGAAFGVGGTGVLFANEIAPFIIGVDTNTATGTVPVFSQTVSIPDFIVYGLSVSTAKRYYNDGVGQPQRRLDARTVNDDTRFGVSGYLDLSLVFCLVGDDANGLTGAAATATREVRAYARDTGSFYQGLFINRDCFILQGGVHGQAIRSMTLTGNVNSPIVAICATLNFEVRDVSFKTGTVGVYTFPMLANYTNKYKDCFFVNTTEGAFYMFSSLSVLENIAIENAGRCAIRSYMSNVYAKLVEVAHYSTNTDRLIATHGGYYGGTHKYDQVFADFEGGICKRSPFYFEQYPNLETEVTVDTVYLGTAAQNLPLFELRSNPDGSRISRLTARGINLAGVPYSYPAKVWGPKWTGSIQLSADNGAGVQYMPPDGASTSLTVTTN